MSRMVNCAKLGQELEGLGRAPFPGDLGQRIIENISKQAWNEWMKQQTILINENRLSAIDPKAQEFLQKEMKKYLFGEED